MRIDFLAGQRPSIRPFSERGDEFAPSGIDALPRIRRDDFRKLLRIGNDHGREFFGGELIICP